MNLNPVVLPQILRSPLSTEMYDETGQSYSIGLYSNSNDPASLTSLISQFRLHYLPVLSSQCHLNITRLTRSHVHRYLSACSIYRPEYACIILIQHQQIITTASASTASATSSISVSPIAQSLCNGSSGSAQENPHKFLIHLIHYSTLQPFSILLHQITEHLHRFKSVNKIKHHSFTWTPLCHLATKEEMEKLEQSSTKTSTPATSIGASDTTSAASSSSSSSFSSSSSPPSHPSLVLLPSFALWHRPSSSDFAQIVSLGVTHIVTILGAREQPEVIRNLCEKYGVKWIGIELEGANQALMRKKETIERIQERMREIKQIVMKGRRVNETGESEEYENETKSVEQTNSCGADAVVSSSTSPNDSVSSSSTSPIRMLFHCAAGIHRTGSLGYVFLRVCGASVEQSLLGVCLARKATSEGVGTQRIQLMENLILPGLGLES